MAGQIVQALGGGVFIGVNAGINSWHTTCYSCLVRRVVRLLKGGELQLAKIVLRFEKNDSDFARRGCYQWLAYWMRFTNEIASERYDVAREMSFALSDLWDAIR